ncbi:MAG: class I SAM-dependent methyltransferase [Actinobacteria bacterium]|nr:class I SAM-dependent methyltransferase [Actinomycetota bacterium]
MSELFSEAAWDERYRSSDALWSGKPNLYLISETSGLSPDSALDAGAGEGADAIWLAERGWHVTAVDISTVALERAAAHAAERGQDIAGRIDWQHEDLTSWQPAEARFHLVSVQYLHLADPERTTVFSRLAAAVAPGGSLLIVGHHPSDLQTTMPRPPMPERFFTGDDIAAMLDDADWDIVTNSAPGRPATDPDGNTVTIHDTVFRASRHPR